MKSAILLLICFFSFSCSTVTYAKKKKKVEIEIDNSLKYENLHGKVKSVSESVYDILNGKHNLLSNSISFYNEQGYITYNNEYSAKDSSFQRQKKYIYDQNFHLTGTLDSFAAGYITFTIFRNNDKGQDTASAYFTKGVNGTKFVSSAIMAYNDKGQMIERKEFFAENKLQSRTTNVYDVDGNLAEIAVYTPDNLIKDRLAYKYDKKRNKIETISYDNTGKIKSKYNFEYKDFDKKGNWQTFIRYQEGKAQFQENRAIEYFK